MWRELILSLAQTDTSPVEILYTPGASKEQLARVEDELGELLPEDLKALLQESNGVRDLYGLHLIWSLEEIARENQEMRTLAVYREIYMSFTDLLFFADAGNGDRFAFPLHLRKGVVQHVYAWDHEDDSRKAVAFSLQSYLERWLGGKLKI